MRYIAALLALVAAAFGQTAPTITTITNAAIPAIDQPPNSINLMPRSMATIFGSNLADSTISAAPPWQHTLGGTEVHLVVDYLITYDKDGYSAYTACTADCELIADLVFVSPTQVNFVAPDVPQVGQNRIAKRSRVVLIRNGVRFDGLVGPLGGVGRVYLNPILGDPINSGFVLFQVGYECLFSFSIIDPASCGLSWSQGEHRAALGAVTDGSSNLITSQNPVHQGQMITLWATGLGGLNQNTTTGLIQQANPISMGFGVAQNSKDFPATIASGTPPASNGGAQGEFGVFQTLPAIWAGESPQFAGLDQINVNFPACTEKTIATVEKRYDAFMIFESFVAGTPVRIYLPFVVSPGEPDCQWATSTATGTTTVLSSKFTQSASAQTLTLTATVSPPSATGTVAFFHGSTPMGTSPLSNGTATFTPDFGLGEGLWSFVATYNGDSNYGRSSGTTTQIVNIGTTTSLTSSSTSAGSGQSLILTATVSPSGATGTVTFSNGTSTLGVGTLSGGKATCGTNSSCSTSAIGSGSPVVKATYNGDSNYGGSSGTLTLVATTVTLTSNASPATFGQSVTLTATVLPCCIATGTVTFIDGTTPIGSGPLVSANGALRAALNTSGLSVGTHAITAHYNGDGNNLASTSSTLTQTVWTLSLTSNPNPSTAGQAVTFTVCGILNGLPGILVFLDGTTTIGVNTSVSIPCSSFSTAALVVGQHSITARYSDDSSMTMTSAVTMQIVNKAPVSPSTTTVAPTSPITYVAGPNGTAVYTVRFDATISPSTATGTVKFFMTNSGLACVNNTCEMLCGGRSSSLAPQATCFYYLPAGTFTITAVYSGDNKLGGSTSTPVSQVVNLLLTSSLSLSVVGQTVTFTANVGWGGATGLMNFYDGTVRIGTSVVSNGKTTFSTTTLSVGSHSITAAFNGDNNAPNSTSAVLTQTVNPH